MEARVTARALGASLLGAAAALALRRAGVDWTPALLAGAGATVFALWREVRGIFVALALLLAAAMSEWPGGVAFVPYRHPLLWLAGFEPFGLATVGIVATARDDRRISRRLLGSWLASSGAATLGLTMCASGQARAGSTLVAGALAWKLGVAPAFAWVPMLLRHPARHIMRLGVVAFAVAVIVLISIAPVLPDHQAVRVTLGVLGAVTLPWAFVNAMKKWDEDRQCARTYAFVSIVSATILGTLLR